MNFAVMIVVKSHIMKHWHWLNTDLLLIYYFNKINIAYIKYNLCKSTLVLKIYLIKGMKIKKKGSSQCKILQLNLKHFSEIEF